MRALLQAHDDEKRRVWVLDSFEGVPDLAQQQARNKDVKLPPDQLVLDVEHSTPGHPRIVKENSLGLLLNQDERQWGQTVTEDYDFDGSGQKTRHLLTVGEQLVRDNFQRYGLLDDQVKFVKGFFNDTLPSIQTRGLKKIAVLRVDGDLYQSTMDVLKNLYPLVEPGGWVILDDWPFPASQRATEDYLRSQGLDAGNVG